MALEIKAIPTLYGKEARRFRKMAEESERKYDLRIKKDITADPRYKSMLTILNNSPIFTAFAFKNNLVSLLSKRYYG